MVNENLILNYFVSLVGIVYAIGLLLREKRERVHILAALLSFVVSVGTLIRAIAMGAEIESIKVLFYFAFGLFPLCLVVFIEGLTERKLPTVVQLIVLSGTVIFSSAILLKPELHRVNIFVSFLVLLHVTALFSSMGLLWESIKAPGVKQRRQAIYWSFLGTLIFSTLLISTDWLRKFGFNVPVLGPIGLYLLIHTMHRVFNSKGDYSLRTEFLDLICAVFSVSLFVSVISVLNSFHLETSAITLGGFMALAFLPYGLLKTVLAKLDLFKTKSLLQRLQAAQTHRGVAGLVDSLQHIDEIEKAVWIPASEIETLGLDQIQIAVRRNSRMPLYWTTDRLQRNYKKARTADERRQIEQLEHILMISGTTMLFPIDPERGFLGLQFTSLMDQNHYAELGQWLSSLARLLPYDEMLPVTIKKQGLG